MTRTKCPLCDNAENDNGEIVYVKRVCPGCLRDHLLSHVHREKEGFGVEGLDGDDRVLIQTISATIKAQQERKQFGLKPGETLVNIKGRQFIGLEDGAFFGVVLDKAGNKVLRVSNEVIVTETLIGFPIGTKGSIERILDPYRNDKCIQVLWDDESITALNPKYIKAAPETSVAVS